jgi:hypothetical protein
LYRKNEPSGSCHTSALPVDPTRRHLLAITAGGAIAGAIPGAALAVGPDAIFAAVERHRELSADYTAAVDISSKLEDGPEFEAADAIAGDRCEDLLDHADALIRLEPTTTAGVIALMRYVASSENGRRRAIRAKSMAARLTGVRPFARRWRTPSIGSAERSHEQHHRTIRVQCGSFEVRYADGRPSQYFYWDNLPSRRLNPNTLDRETALEKAKAAARAAQGSE